MNRIRNALYRLETDAAPAGDIESSVAILRDEFSQAFTTAYLRLAQWREGNTTQTPEEIFEQLWADLAGEKELYECAYCQKELPDNHTLCCGEVGHVEVRNGRD